MTKLVGTIDCERTLGDEADKKKKSDSDDEEAPPKTNNYGSLSSYELIPGDIVYLKANTKAVCDMILLEGECLVDEAVLTGESVPCSKIQLPDTSEIFEKDKNYKNIIFCGSKII